MRKPLLILILVFSALSARAQQIEFGQYYDGNTLSAQVIQHLDFGGVISGDIDPKLRELGSGLEGVIEIEGIPFLDVVVTITEINKLYLDGDITCSESSCEMDVMLQYAYTNTGIMDFAPNYENVAIQFIGNMARFPIIRRQSGPPGPPPTPNINGVALPPLQKAYIYIYGQASATLGTDAGAYGNTLTVTIEYM
ncbi:MAG: hypothetical protein LAT57_12510 [Balneolales bacterium]|nr:hypothetical protein [Balneolales bacterium]